MSSSSFRPRDRVDSGLSVSRPKPKSRLCLWFCTAVAAANLEFFAKLRNGKGLRVSVRSGFFQLGRGVFAKDVLEEVGGTTFLAIQLVLTVAGFAFEEEAISAAAVEVVVVFVVALVATMEFNFIDGSLADVEAKPTDFEELNAMFLPASELSGSDELLFVNVTVIIAERVDVEVLVGFSNNDEAGFDTF